MSSALIDVNLCCQKHGREHLEDVTVSCLMLSMYTFKKRRVCPDVNHTGIYSVLVSSTVLAKTPLPQTVGVVCCGTIWCGLVWCGVEWSGVEWFGWCGVVWCGVVWCGGVVWSGVSRVHEKADVHQVSLAGSARHRLYIQDAQLFNAAVGCMAQYRAGMNIAKRHACKNQHSVIDILCQSIRADKHSAPVPAVYGCCLGPHSCVQSIHCHTGVHSQACSQLANQVLIHAGPGLQQQTIQQDRLHRFQSACVPSHFAWCQCPRADYKQYGLASGQTMTCQVHAALWFRV